MRLKREASGVLFETTQVIGVAEVPNIWRRASEGDSDAEVTMDCLLGWSEGQRERVPSCINCDEPMGPVHIAAYALMHGGDHTLVTAVCADCAITFAGAHEVPAAVLKGLQRRGYKAIKLPNAGHA